MNEKRGYDLIAADVVLAQKGDAEAMERILADVQDSVYYNCRTMLHDEQAAQDATQDILITVYRKIGTVSDPKAYIGWVRRITANHCKNRLCKVNREFLMPAAEDDKDPFAAFEDTDEQRVPEKAFDNEETRRMVVDLVNKLPDEQRMCVMLFYYDELKTREIAETLSVSEGTVKSRLNYARKAIKEGVRDYEKKGVKLYGLSPIPFLGYFLGKTAAATTAPIVLANVTAAATAATAAAGAAAAGGTATAASASATAASGGLAAFLTTTAGKIAAGVVAAAMLGGAGLGAAKLVQKAIGSQPAAVVSAQTETPTEAPTFTPSPKPTAVPTPVPTPTPAPTPEPTPEPPEMTFQRLTGLDETETAYLLNCLTTVLAGENGLGFVTESPIAEIWEIHSLAAYRAYRETDAWKGDVPESELPCYGVRLADGTVFYLYLGDGLPRDGVTAHEWEVYRVWNPDTGETLTEQTYLSGPQWTEWSEKQPPQDALEVQTRKEHRLRKYKGITILVGVSSYYNQSEFRADADGRANGEVMFYRNEGFVSVSHNTDVLIQEDTWTYIGEYSSPDANTDIITYSDGVYYRSEWNEETGKWEFWQRSYYRAAKYTLYTNWTKWYDIQDAIHESDVYSGTGDPTETQERTFCRWRKR